MGGSSNALGNTTKFAEYNFWVDPEAADIVLNSRIPITMIGWDPSLYDAMIDVDKIVEIESLDTCLLYTSPSPRDATPSRMPSSG